MGKWRWWYD